MIFLQKFNQLFGFLLLFVVNLVWVASFELTKHLYSDLNFKRPFFATYIKSSMFIFFFLRYACRVQDKLNENYNFSTEKVNYSKLNINGSDEEYELENLTAAEFESLSSDVESDFEKTNDQKNNNINNNSNKTINQNFSASFDEISLKTEKKNKRVRFAMLKEIRRFPKRIQKEAKLARLSYQPSSIHWICKFKSNKNFNFSIINYSLYFAFLWFLTSISYQVALLYCSVSTVNLISASSSLIILILGAIFGSRKIDRFSISKLILILINLSGVAIVSKFSTSFYGIAATFLSAISNAVYLFSFSFIKEKFNGPIDINLMLGFIGIFSIIVYTPITILMHWTGIEIQTPAPTLEQMFFVIFIGFFSSLFADYLFLYATLLTNALISSLSTTLSIPLSMIADLIFRNQSPNYIEIFATIPIVVSFIGASFIDSTFVQSKTITLKTAFFKSCFNGMCGICMGTQSKKNFSDNSKNLSKVSTSFAVKTHQKHLSNALRLVINNEKASNYYCKNKKLEKNEADMLEKVCLIETVNDNEN